MVGQGIVGNVIDIRRLLPYTATDDFGNISYALVEAVVSHDKGKK